MSGKNRTNGRKQHHTLKIIKVEYVEVPDAEERLGRVFKILLSNKPAEIEESLEFYKHGGDR